MEGTLTDVSRSQAGVKQNFTVDPSFSQQLMSANCIDAFTIEQIESPQ
jgi:hypothetical protein